jgi:hypothetical protein
MWSSKPRKCSTCKASLNYEDLEASGQQLVKKKELQCKKCAKNPAPVEEFKEDNGITVRAVATRNVSEA